MSAGGRWALVTGATGGIGFALSEELARRGWNVVLTGRNTTRLMSLAGRVAALGADVRCVQCDLATKDGPAQLVADVDALGIEIGILANNAGQGYSAPFAESDLERQQRLVQLNVTSVMELAHAYAGRMAARGEGRILNVASVAGVTPGPGMATYFASKAFVLSLSQAMHEELRPRGVHVMALCPGPVGTAFWERAESSAAAWKQAMPSAERVARIAYVALMRGRAVCAPGALSKLCYGFGRMAPYTASRRIVGALLGR